MNQQVLDGLLDGHALWLRPCHSVKDDPHHPVDQLDHAHLVEEDG